MLRLSYGDLNHCVTLGSVAGLVSLLSHVGRVSHAASSDRETAGIPRVSYLPFKLTWSQIDHDELLCPAFVCLLSCAVHTSTFLR